MTEVHRFSRKVSGDALRRLRADRLWSQQEAAGACGVSLPTYQRAEASDVLYGRTIRKLAQGFGVDPHELLAEEAPTPELEQPEETPDPKVEAPSASGHEELIEEALAEIETLAEWARDYRAYAQAELDRRIEEGDFPRMQYQVLAAAGQFVHRWWKDHERDLEDEDPTREQLRRLGFAERAFLAAADIARRVVDQGEALEGHAATQRDEAKRVPDNVAYLFRGEREIA